MSSKKAKRKLLYLERVEKRLKEQEKRKEFDDVMESGSMEEMARVMGIRLK